MLTLTSQFNPYRDTRADTEVTARKYHFLVAMVNDSAKASYGVNFPVRYMICYYNHK